MPGIDWLPVVSQLKSTVQLITGDVDGAVETMENFARECPGVSQMTSVIQLATGDAKGALETQKCCGRTLNNAVNAVPVVGHVKGGIHHLVGDHEGGNQALNSATRTAAVVASGAAAAIATGGIGAIPAGIAAGATYDGIASAVTDKPQGLIAAVERAIDDPNAGNIFDAAFVPVGDGVSGYAGGQAASNYYSSTSASGSGAGNSVGGSNGFSSESGGGYSGGGGGIFKATNTFQTAAQTFVNGAKTGLNCAQAAATVPGTYTGAIGYAQQNDSLTSKSRPDTVYHDVYLSPTQIPVELKKANYMTNFEKFHSNIDEELEDAFLYDDYLQYESRGEYDTREKKEAKLKEKKNQKSNGHATKFAPIITETEAKKRQDDFQKPQPNTQIKEKFLSKSWLHVPMPKKLNYTGAIMTNNPGQGLLHSFLRHRKEWKRVIPNYFRSQGFLSIELEKLLEAIENAPTESEAKRLIDKFRTEVFYKLDNEQLRVLYNCEMMLYRFLISTVKDYENYLGEGCNNDGKQQVFWKVKDTKGNPQVMVVCVSDELYDPDIHLGDPRPYRTITTIFFISWEDFVRRLILKLC